MIDISATLKKLDEARACLHRLQAGASAIPLNRQEFDHRLSAFLSAAYSIHDVLTVETRKVARGWVGRWWDARGARDQALRTFMRDQRKAELHGTGAMVRLEQKNIPYMEYQWRKEAGRKSRGHPALDGMSMSSGPWGLAPLPLEFPIDIFMLGDEEATEVCAQYVRLLEQMVREFLEAHQQP